MNRFLSQISLVFCICFSLVSNTFAEQAQFEWKNEKPRVKITGSSNLDQVKTEFDKVTEELIKEKMENAVDEISRESIAGEEEDGSIEDAFVVEENDRTSIPIGNLVTVPEVTFLGADYSDEIKDVSTTYVAKDTEVDSQTVNGTADLEPKEAIQYWKDQFKKGEDDIDYEDSFTNAALSRFEMTLNDGDSSDLVLYQFNPTFKYSFSNPDLKRFEKWQGETEVDYKAGFYEIRTEIKDNQIVLFSFHPWHYLRSFLDWVGVWDYDGGDFEPLPDGKRNMFKGHELIGELSFTSHLGIGPRRYEDTHYLLGMGGSSAYTKFKEDLDQEVKDDMEENGQGNKESDRAISFHEQGIDLTGHSDWENVYTNAYAYDGVISWLLRENSGLADQETILRSLIKKTQSTIASIEHDLTSNLTDLNTAKQTLMNLEVDINGLKEHLQSLQKLYKESHTDDILDQLKSITEQLKSAYRFLGKLSETAAALQTAYEILTGQKEALDALLEVLQQKLAMVLELLRKPDRVLADLTVGTLNATFDAAGDGAVGGVRLLLKTTLGIDFGFASEFGKISYDFSRGSHKNTYRVWYYRVDSTALWGLLDFKGDQDSFSSEENKDHREEEKTSTIFKAKEDGTVKMSGSATGKKSLNPNYEGE